MKTTLILTVFMICFAGSAGAADQPNIVLIFADDLGWKDVAYNNDDGFIETPNLDRMKREGMIFPQAYAAAGNCAPSRACLLSGKYGGRHGVYAVGSTDRGPKQEFRLNPVPNTPHLRPEFVTMAEALKAQGYVSGHFGKWHLGSADKGTGPQQQGFDVSPPDLIATGEADPDNESASGRKRGKAQGQTRPENPKKIESITDAACAFMTEHKARPFFAFVSHHAVHSPLKARPESTSIYIPLSSLHLAARQRLTLMAKTCFPYSPTLPSP